jgi:hypothetical protein
VFHFAAVFYPVTELLYFWISAHFQKHFIRIGDGQGLFNQAMLNQNAMIGRYCELRWMGRRSALPLSRVFHCTMLTRFLDAVTSFALMRFYICGSASEVRRLSGNRYLFVFGDGQWKGRSANCCKAVPLIKPPETRYLCSSLLGEMLSRTHAFKVVPIILIAFFRCLESHHDLKLLHGHNDARS